MPLPWECRSGDEGGETGGTIDGNLHSRGWNQGERFNDGQLWGRKITRKSIHNPSTLKRSLPEFTRRGPMPKSLNTQIPSAALANGGQWGSTPDTKSQSRTHREVGRVRNRRGRRWSNNEGRAEKKTANALSVKEGKGGKRKGTRSATGRSQNGN